MGSHPLNLGLRFILELIALVSLGIWGWTHGLETSMWVAVGLSAGIPIVAATIWGIFNVPGDPSRSGRAPIRVSGTVRLMLELLFFGLSTYCLYDLAYTTQAYILGGVIIAHYIFSYDRVYWLIRQKG